MIVHRCFAWNARARPDEQDGPLWVPRAFQGDGRHDNPDVYGCLYLAEGEVSAVVEQLARFRTQRLQAALLRPGPAIPSEAATQDHANESARSARIARISSSARPARIRSIGRRSPRWGLMPNSQASAASF